MTAPQQPKNKVLRLLSAGAAQSVVQALAEPFRQDTGATIQVVFGAVGAIADQLKAGTPADLIILTRAMIDGLVAEGRIAPDAVGDLGEVCTGVAVRNADPAPVVSDAASLREALLASEGIYFPDPVRATAGIHFARVIDELGIWPAVQARLRTFPNGATTMKALASATGERLIGVTQVTEINNTGGVKLVATLPPGFELSTLYSVGVCKGAPAEAGRFAQWLAGERSRALRSQAGFV